MMRRTVVATLAGLAAFALAFDASAADVKAPAQASKLRENLKKLYGDLDFSESIARGEAMTDLHAIVAKEKKDNPLKYTQWWSAQVLESLYTGKKFVKQPAKTKEIVKAEFDCFPAGEAKPAVKAPFVYRGPSGYSPKTPTPMLVSIVDAKTDPKAYLEKTWAANADMAKDWLLVCVPESDGFDVTKDSIALSRLYGRMIQAYNVDPNRFYVEGVGSACKAAQHVGMWTFADRLAGLVLRNPQEAVANENMGLFPTLVVRGAEGFAKAEAVLAKVREAAGDTHAVELVAPDTASVEGLCQGVADWLRNSPGRELARTYSWVATFDKDNNCPNPWTGSFVIVSPIKREEPTKVKVSYLRDSNTVDIQAANLGEFVVCMNDDLLDLDKEVAVFVNGAELKKGVFERNTMTMLEHADAFAEWGHMYPAQFRAFVPTTVAPPEKKPDGAGGGDKK